MEEQVTKDDLRQFGLALVDTMRKMVEGVVSESEDINSEWLKGRCVRRMLDMSQGSLQNLRVTGKIRFKKILGSYYYNRKDLQNMFDD